MHPVTIVMYILTSLAGRKRYRDQKVAQRLCASMFLLFGNVFDGLFRIEFALHIIDKVIVAQI
jgi:hypothetical protein